MLTANEHSIAPQEFRRKLIEWGQANFRPFPWRFTTDPYELLMAEVMLHRTRAKQVEPIYQRFLTEFPDLRSAQNATRKELHDILCPLGLRWRIDSIHQMFGVLKDKHNGLIPIEKNALQTLPGVSDYVASAIRCFAWNLPEPLIDTNTVRVVGRLFNLEIKDSSRRNPLFRRLITELVDPAEPKAYNYALLDLAEKICTVKTSPQHEHCPVATMCLRYKIWPLELSNLG